MKPVFLWTDLLIYLLIIGIIIVIFLSRRKEVWREQWRSVGQRKLGMIACIILIAFTIVALCDSIHFKAYRPANNASTVLGIQSLLDVLIRPLGKQNEETYSAPFAIYSSIKRSAFINGSYQTSYPRLVYSGQHLKSLDQKTSDIIKKSSIAIATGLVLSAIVILSLVFILAKKAKLTFIPQFRAITLGQTTIAWREILITIAFIMITACYIKMMSPYYHLFGTNKIGGDVLYETIKSIRTGLIIGTLTTLVMLPFAVYFGTEAGYFGGWRDDIIQYVYTTLSSIPSVLLISAAVLSLEIYISNHPDLFVTLEARADARLLALCIILGITSWTTLCRLLRAETLKLRELDFVKASIAMGVKNIKVIWRHIVPNVLHIILITVVLDFSALVLAEAVLSYVGVGVDPITPSWGNMINSARLDLAREPVVWWPLMAAFVFMFTLVLAANLFADAVRDAFDPRLRNEE